MNEIHVSIVGNAVTDVRQSVTNKGHHVATFRMAATTRRFNREADRWEDLDTSYVTVACWRSLADHVGDSVKKGDPLVVIGRLRVREYLDSTNRAAINVEVEASSVGHDLARGRSSFTRTRREAPEVAEPAARPEIAA